MPGETADDRLARIIESLVERHRRGEITSITEYAEKHPELADGIRDVYEALRLLDHGKPSSILPPGSSRESAEEGTQEGKASDLLSLGEYRIVREVGRGGMGVVYEAVQEPLGRRVALKVLPFHSFLDKTYLERFRREARAAASLQHPNIVPVHGVGEDRGTHYYAMQFIEGQSLDVLLRELKRLRGQREQGPERSSRAPSAIASGREGDGSSPNLLSSSGSQRSYSLIAARLGLQVAEALSFAHSQGVLHRDIKPSNLLVDGRGNVWVTDFGLAKVENDADLTGTGELVGTLRYMGPERLQGWSDPRSDVYGLGMTLYEVLTLRPAFLETDRGLLAERVRRDEPPRPRRINRRIPRDLETIILKAIEKEPSQRYQTAAELAEDLRRFIDGRAIAASGTTPLGRTWRWCRRNRTLAALGLLIALLLVAVAVVSSVSAVRLRKNLEQVQRAETEARDNLRDSYLAQARAGRWSRRAGQRFSSLAALGKATAIRPGVDLRNEAIACMTLVDLEPAKVLELGESSVAAFDHDLERYALADSDGTITVRKLSTDEVVAHLPSSGARVVRIDFSRDGRYLASRGQEGESSEIVCRVWNIERGEEALRVRAGRTNAALDFSEGEKHVALIGADRAVGIYQLDPGNELRRLAVGPEPLDVAFQPGAPLLAVSSRGPGGIQIWDFNTGELLKTLPQTSGVWGLAWHPSGRFLAAGSADRRIYVWEVAQGRQRAILIGHQSDVVSLAFSHRGDLLASQAWDGTTRLWDPFAGRELVATAGAYIAPRFRRDDALLAAYDSGQGKVGTWAVATGSECKTFHWEPPDDIVFDVQVHPGGRILAAGGHHGVRLWDLAFDKEVGYLPQRGCLSLFFHPVSGDLYTSGQFGLKRWSLRVDEERSVVRVGSPEVLEGPIQSESARACLSRDCRWIVCVTGPGKAVRIDLEGKREKMPIVDHPGVGFLSISPKSEWLATGTWQGTGVKVWDLESGELLRDLPVEGDASVAFSPDGRWLVTGSSKEYRFWEVGSWQPGHSIPREMVGNRHGRMAFSPDGRILALARTRSQIELVDVGALSPLALLEGADFDAQEVYGFSADGTALLATAGFNRARLWDLRRIREKLGGMGLDWEMLGYAAKGELRPQGPVALELDGE